MYVLLLACVMLYNTMASAMDEDVFDLEYLSRKSYLNLNDVKRIEKLGDQCSISFNNRVAAEQFHETMENTGYRIEFFGLLNQVILKDRKIASSRKDFEDAFHQVSNVVEKPGFNNLLDSNDAKNLSIFNIIYRYVYSFSEPAKLGGEFMIRQGIDYLIVTAKFPKPYALMVGPELTAVGMWSNGSFILAIVTPRFQCPSSKIGAESWQSEKIRRWFLSDTFLKEESVKLQNQYDESLAKFSSSALENFEQIIKSVR